MLTTRETIPVTRNTAVKAYGEFPTANQMSITAKDYGLAQNDYVVEVLNTVTAGAETQVWTEGKVTFNIQTGVSTITQLRAAAGGVTGTPWADIAAIAAGSATVAALAATTVRNLPDKILGAMSQVKVIDLETLSPKAHIDPVLFLKSMDGISADVALEESNDEFVGVKAYGESGVLSVEALYPGQGPNTYTIQITNTVTAGGETHVWTSRTLVIAVQAGVSTVAQAIAAAGGVTGTPWGTVGKAAAALLTQVVPAAVGATAITSLTIHTHGRLAGTRKSSDLTIVNMSKNEVVVLSGCKRYLRLLASSSGNTILDLTIVHQ